MASVRVSLATLTILMFVQHLVSLHISRLRSQLPLILIVIALFGQVHQTSAAPAHPVLEPVIRQTSLTDCGLAALAMLLRDKALIRSSVATLDNLAAVLIDPKTQRHRQEGYSVSELQTLTSAFGYLLKAQKLTLKEFYAKSFPVMVWIDLGDGGHFTLVEKVTATSVSLADPTRGRLTIDHQTWRELWLERTTGIAFELERPL